MNLMFSDRSLSLSLSFVMGLPWVKFSNLGKSRLMKFLYLHFVEDHLLMLSFDCHLDNWYHLCVSYATLGTIWDDIEQFFPFGFWAKDTFVGFHVIIDMTEVMFILAKVHERHSECWTPNLTSLFDLISYIVLELF